MPLVAVLLGGLGVALLWRYGATRCAAVLHSIDALGHLWSRTRVMAVALFGGGSFLMAAAGLSALWGWDQADLTDDSLFTLALGPRIGLILLSGALIYGLFWLSAAKSQFLYRQAGRRWLLLAAACDLLASGLLFLLAAVLSPQLYYSYYRLVIPGLPEQWVIGRNSIDVVVAKLTSARATASLADIAVAASFWGLLVMTLCCFLLAAGWMRRPGDAWWAGAVVALVIGLIHLARL